MDLTDRSHRKRRVAVLMGGTSSERPISLSTGNMILMALDPDKYDVIAIDTRDILTLSGSVPSPLPTGESCAPDPTDIGKVSSALETPSSSALAPQDRSRAGCKRPDVVFIALHGKGGEDGAVQGMLEMMGLPYTGSGVLASALAMDKAMAKRLFRAEGLPVIEEVLVPHCRVPTDLVDLVSKRLGFPVFVKPNAEGSTFGCSLVASAQELIDAVAQAHRYDSLALIEKYVQGTEITVSVLGNPGESLQALPVIEIVPKSAYYDYESKYAEGGSEHIIPARLSAALTHTAQELARRCHDLLGCRGMSRTDMIVSEDRLFILEVNTIPGMTPTSLLPQAAAHAGITFSALLDRLIDSALNSPKE
jgi:D-alanine-D-alanine ligase